MCWRGQMTCGETSVCEGRAHVAAWCDSPVVEGTPVYSGETASVGELAEETPAEWTE